ncbi:hypothetical protein ABLG96_08450 [Nakamurella sp. A5-74]|uniref:Transposase n=1 Tax=Nakamurella sp. A5-74 TaxID=3158264 RepID=A0AAU8DVM6_9ACTN
MDGTHEESAGQAGTLSGVLTRAQLGELYTGPPAEFVVRRKNLVAAVRAAGDKEAARAVAALRKPTTPAWVVNLLAEDGRTAPELLELAAEIAAAVTAGERAELRTLAAAQRILVIDVLERAAELAAASGTTIPPAAAEVVEAAVRGVLTDPSTAEQLFTGVLVELPDPDDAESLPELAIRSHSPQQQGAPAAPRKNTRSAPDRASAAPAPASAPATERKRHLRAVRDASAAVRTAERARARSADSVSDLQDERDRLGRALEDLERRLTGARDDLHAAEAEVSRAEQAHRQVEASEDR